MSPDASATLTDAAGKLTGIAAAMRIVSASQDAAMNQQERDGVAVLMAEIDSIVEGIGTLLSGGGEK